MNYAYYKELQKKEWRKNFIFIALVLLFATISTYLIYYNFKEERDEILHSKSLEVTYHEKDGNKVTLNKVTPVTDYVGLSSDPYTLTIKNNTNAVVKYKIKLVEDREAIDKDDCSNKLIPKNIIKVAIHEKGEVSKVYNLDDISNLESGVLEPKEKKDYMVRVWITNNSIINRGSKLHYHGLLEVEEK